MATKMSRTQLKQVVKECLIEILQEGLGFFDESEDENDYERSVHTLPPQRKNHVSENKNTQLENRVAKGEAREALARPRSSSLDTPFAELLSNKKKSGSSNSLNEILSDTAHSNNSILSEKSSEHDHLRFSEQLNGNPDEIFGKEVSSKWASLAFGK